jgi:uncharacterized membrane protein
MISFLLALAPFIPIVLQIAGIMIKWFGASEKNLKLYEELIKNAKDAGQISVENATKLQSYREQMRADYETRKKEKEKENGSET